MSTNAPRRETLDKRGCNVHPWPTVIYGFRNVAVKDAKLKVSRGWRALRLSGTFHEIVAS